MKSRGRWVLVANQRGVDSVEALRKIDLRELCSRTIDALALGSFPIDREYRSEQPGAWPMPAIGWVTAARIRGDGFFVKVEGTYGGDPPRPAGLTLSFAVALGAFGTSAILSFSFVSRPVGLVCREHRRRGPFVDNAIASFEALERVLESEG